MTSEEQEELQQSNTVSVERTTTRTRTAQKL